MRDRGTMNVLDDWEGVKFKMLWYYDGVQEEYLEMIYKTP